MLKHKIVIHNIQIGKALEIFKEYISPQALLIIKNMQHIIDELIKENQELESIVNEETINGIGRI